MDSIKQTITRLARLKTLRTLIICVTVLIGLLIISAAFAHQPVTVTRVVDGDTIDVTWDAIPGVTISSRIRIRGIQAPETYRPDCDAERSAGEASTRYLSALLADRVVTLENVRHGAYSGRHVASVYAGTADVAEVMIQTGHAVAYDGRGKAPKFDCTPQ